MRKFGKDKFFKIVVENFEEAMRKFGKDKF